MNLDSKSVPVLFSTGTALAYMIAQRYYGGRHYVWATASFHSDVQPPSSDPQAICNLFLQQTTRGDRHSADIERIKTGILNGAWEKLSRRVINRAQYEQICNHVSLAEYKDFCPVIYMINTEKVKNKCLEVDNADKAREDSIEYKITDLDESEFEAIFMSDVLHGVVRFADRRAGE